LPFFNQVLISFLEGRNAEALRGVPLCSLTSTCCVVSCVFVVAGVHRAVLHEGSGVSSWPRKRVLCGHAASDYGYVYFVSTKWAIVCNMEEEVQKHQENSLAFLKKILIKR